MRSLGMQHGYEGGEGGRVTRACSKDVGSIREGVKEAIGLQQAIVATATHMFENKSIMPVRLAVSSGCDLTGDGQKVWAIQVCIPAGRG